jgi:hypothetical protein
MEKNFAQMHGLSSSVSPMIKSSRDSSVEKLYVFWNMGPLPQIGAVPHALKCF